MSAPDVAKAWTSSRAILLAGDDSAARLTGLRALSELAAAEGDLDMEQIVADDRPVGDWFAAVGTTPFLSEFRSMVVRNAGRIPFEDAYSQWLKDLPTYARLVLVFDEEGGDEDKQRRTKTNTDRWSKAVANQGGTVLLFEVPKKGVPALVVARAKEMGVKLNNTTAQILVEMVGGKADAAFQELEKLSLMVEHGETLTADHVRQMVTPDPEYNVFKLAQAVIEGSRGEALRQLTVQVGRAKDIPGEAFGRIFPTLVRQIKLVWQARAAIEAGSNFAHPTQALQGALLKSPSLSTSAPFAQEQAMRLARRTTFQRLANCYAEVVRAEAMIKGQDGTGTGPVEVLEQMILRMAAG